jgi:hypothetical protein
LKGWEACPGFINAEKEMLITHTVKTGKAGRLYAEYRSALDPNHQFQFSANKPIIEAAKELFDKMKNTDSTVKVGKTNVGSSYKVNAVNTFQMLESHSDIEVPDGGVPKFHVRAAKVEELEEEEVLHDDRTYGELLKEVNSAIYSDDLQI